MKSFLFSILLTFSITSFAQVTGDGPTKNPNDDYNEEEVTIKLQPVKPKVAATPAPTPKPVVVKPKPTPTPEPKVEEKEVEAPKEVESEKIELPKVEEPNTLNKMVKAAEAPAETKPETHAAVDGVSAEQSLHFLKNGNTRFVKGYFRKDGQAKKISSASLPIKNPTPLFYLAAIRGFHQKWYSIKNSERFSRFAQRVKR